MQLPPRAFRLHLQLSVRCIVVEHGQPGPGMLQGACTAFCARFVRPAALLLQDSPQPWRAGLHADTHCGRHNKGAQPNTVTAAAAAAAATAAAAAATAAAAAAAAACTFTSSAGATCRYLSWQTQQKCAARHWHSSSLFCQCSAGHQHQHQQGMGSSRGAALAPALQHQQHMAAVPTTADDHSTE